MKPHFFFFALFLLPGFIFAQSKADSLLIGKWTGTSICQVKPSGCNDEISVCYITKTKKANTYHLVINKIINGKEEDMAADDYLFNPADNTLFCNIEKYKVTIKLTVKGRNIDGVLLSDNKLWRVIKLKKES